MDTLKKRSEFLAVAKGGRLGRRAFVVQGLQRDTEDAARVGYTVTKKTGNSVMGAIVIDRRFVSQELDAGHLISPDWTVLELETGYWFVRSPARTLTRPVAAFRDWLYGATAGAM